MPRRKWRYIQVPPAIGPAIFGLPCDSFHTYADRLENNFRGCTTLRDSSQSQEGCQKGLLNQINGSRTKMDKSIQVMAK